MSNEYYDHTTYPATSSTLASSPMRSELDFIEAGFDKLPALTGNGGKLTAINAGGTSMEAITTTGTGSGVRATSPTLVTPDIGAANATSINRVNIAGVATGATLAMADNSSLSTIGGYAAAFVFTGATNVTVPTSGTLLTSATPVASLAGGAAGQIAYQSATDVTSFIPVGAVGRALVSNGSSPPGWTNGALSLGGNLSTVGALATIGNFSANLTFTGNTAVTFPTSGVLALAGANTDITSLSNVTVPTQANATANTAIANTLFVSNAITNTPSLPQIQTISGSVASNALTIGAGALTLGFRSTTLTSGTITTVTSTPSNLVVPSGATLGTVNAVASSLVVLALNNAGTIELAVINLSGGNDLTETGLISTTAISAGSSSASVAYSTTARTSVAYRVIGRIDSTQATAGTWATTPSLIQGAGGQAITAMSSLGYGQTWQNVTGSRAVGTTYYNTTGRPILVFISGNSTAFAQFNTGGIAFPFTTASSTVGAGTFLVMPGASYSVTNLSIFTNWNELR
jgi:hypothetical protein